MPINRDEISQGQLDIDNKTRSNLFSWNGQFSPQFVEVLLNCYAQDGDIVIDPFAGSGTTLCEAARKGVSAYGMELNASAYYMAKTYELANMTISERKNIVNSVEKILETVSDKNEILPVITCAIQSVSRIVIIECIDSLLDLFNNELTLLLLHKKWAGLKKIVLEIPVYI